MIVPFGVALAFGATGAAGVATGLYDLPERTIIAITRAAADASRHVTEIGAIEIEPDAAHESGHHRIAEAGVAEDAATFGAIDAASMQSSSGSASAFSCAGWDDSMD